MKMQTAKIAVSGMTCGSCAANIAEKLSSSAEKKSGGGIQSIDVSFPEKLATVTFDSSKLSKDEVLAKISALGFGTQLISCRDAASPTDSNDDEEQEQAQAQVTVVKVSVSGMTCTSCAGFITDKLKAEEGIHDVNVSFPDKLATIELLPSGDTNQKWNGESLTQKIADLGFGATLESVTSEAKTVVINKNENNAANNCSVVEIDTADASPKTSTCEFFISGMSCASCAARIEASLTNYKGVILSNVNFATTTATVTFDEALLSPEMIEEQISSLGYPAQLVAENANEQLRTSLEREAESEEAKNHFLWALVLGLPLAIVVMTFHNSKEAHMKLVRGGTIVNNLNALHVIEFVISTPVVLFIGRGYYVRCWASLQHGVFTMDTLVTIGVLGSYIFSVVAFILNATGAANFTSYFETSSTLLAFMLLGKYLEINAKRQTSSAIVKLMDLSPPTALLLLDSKEVPIAIPNTSSSSSSSHDQVLNENDKPVIAKALSEQASSVEIPSRTIKKGNIVRVLAGERVPVDGTVIDGHGAVDEAMVTGESVPQEKEFGSHVIGGTLNLNQDLVVRADKVGEETMLSQILRIVREAQGSKPAIQIVADNIAGVFVPFVIVWCLLVLAVWLGTGLSGAYPDDWRKDGQSAAEFALSFFISAIIIACPCALGLATPTAVMVGTGIGAEQGVLIKGGPTLEAARSINCVLFDKTGTLTTGQLRVTDFILTNVEGQKFTAGTIKKLLGTVESRSTHPIAKCLTSTFGILHPPFELKTELLRGAGMTGELDVSSCTCPPSCHCIYKNTNMEDIVVGSLKLMEQDKKYEISADVRKFIDGAHDEGRTVILLAAEGKIRICVALADEPKPESADLIAELKRRGIRTVMVTGDNKYAAHRVANKIGISDPEKDVFAQQLPQDKASVVKKLQEEGHQVAFVGDGVNDSPALTQANVGIALGAGTEVAIESADAVLVRNSLVDIVTFFDLSDVTVTRIQLNFVWAFLYNIIALPFASGVFYPVLHWQLPPVVAVVAMVVSSLTVLASSLLIKLFKPRWHYSAETDEEKKKQLAGREPSSSEISKPQDSTFSAQEIVARDHTAELGSTEVPLLLSDAEDGSSIQKRGCECSNAGKSCGCSCGKN